MAHPSTRAYLRDLHDPVKCRRMAQELRPGDEAFAQHLERVVRAASAATADAVPSVVNENGRAEVGASTRPLVRVGTVRGANHEQRLDHHAVSPE